MRVLVCGSRTWTDRKIIHKVLHHLTEDDIVVHGGNGSYDRFTREWSGADILSDQFAAVHSIPRRPYPVTDVEWKTQGRSAGPKRNRRMYNTEQPEQVIAFRMSGDSVGTDDMVRVALAGGTQVYVKYLHEDGHLREFSPTSWENYCELIGRKP